MGNLWSNFCSNDSASETSEPDSLRRSKSPSYASSSNRQNLSTRFNNTQSYVYPSSRPTNTTVNHNSRKFRSWASASNTASHRRTSNSNTFSSNRPNIASTSRSTTHSQHVPKQNANPQVFASTHARPPVRPTNCFPSSEITRNRQLVIRLDSIRKLLDSNGSLQKTSQFEYIENFETMIQYELNEELDEIRSYNQSDLILTAQRQRQFYFPVTEDMDELCDAIDENRLNQLVLKPKSRNESDVEIKGRVVQMKNDKIYIEMCSYKSFRMVDTADNYSLHFQVNRKNFELQMSVLSFIDMHNLFDCFINHPAYRLDGNSIDTLKENYSSWLDYRRVYKIDTNSEYLEGLAKHKVFNHYSPHVNFTQGLNDEQKKAVENIVNCTSYPLPYLVSGHAGTGKTKTIVAAIHQIVQFTQKKVLVCAMSNSACDEIAERLLDLVVSDAIFRLYATSYAVNKISPAIKLACNMKSATGKLYKPSTASLYNHRVVICTLSTASSLAMMSADSSTFDAEHFQYVFIDECASTPEPMALIPIAGLCSSPNIVHANIILSGDPKLLPPVIKSTASVENCLEVSWMERLLGMPLYKYDPQTGKYSSAYITRLTRNYRSHPDILRVSNELFYENQMEAKAPADITNRFANVRVLPFCRFPLIFKSVPGLQQSARQTPSLFNKKEVDAVVGLLKKLLAPSMYLKQSDIGIITPYKKQCNEIGQACRVRSWNDITIGTPETFHGKQKSVVIVSTVRSGGKCLGFVNNRRRINFIITRAQSLLIIVGDPQTLKTDVVWQRILKYCLNHGSLIQSNEVFSL